MGDIRANKVDFTTKKPPTLDDYPELLRQERLERANNPNLSEKERQRARESLVPHVDSGISPSDH